MKYKRITGEVVDVEFDKATMEKIGSHLDLDETCRIDYLMAECLREDETTKTIGKVHLVAIDFKNDRYVTLCGIDHDYVGFWPFSIPEIFNDSERGCKRCKRVLEKHRMKFFRKDTE